MSMSYNSVKSSNAAQYVNTQINSKLKVALNYNAKPNVILTSLFKTDLTGQTIVVPQTSADAVVGFNASFVPALEPTGGNGLFSTSLVSSDSNFTELKYSGSNSQVTVEIGYYGNTAAVTDILTAQLFLNGVDISADISGGRNYGVSTTAEVVDPSGNGVGALLDVTVVAGKITAITVIKTGSGYSSDSYVVINDYGGRDASATPTNVGGAITAVSLVNTKICPQESGIAFTPADGELRGGTATYTFNLVTNDVLSLRIKSTESGSGNTAGTAKVFKAFMKVSLPSIIYEA